jgi:hypothetical protein
MEWLEEADKVTPHVSNYHKESFYEHTVLAATSAACHNASRPVFIASLLHDIGKPETCVERPEKGATFYNHETHLDLINEFLTEDDIHYNVVCELIKLHMLPYQFNGPEPWRSYAEKQMLEVLHNHDALFISFLYELHRYDMVATYTEYAPDTDSVRNSRRIIDVHVDNNISDAE